MSNTFFLYNFKSFVYVSLFYSIETLTISIPIIFSVTQFVFSSLLSKICFTPSVSIDEAEPLKFALHFGAWFLCHSCSAWGSLLVSCLWQVWQTLLSTATSRHLPVSIDSTATQPFNEEWPLFCQVPSQETPQFENPSTSLLGTICRELFYA